MAKKLPSTDITAIESVPELLQLVEEVRRSHKPHLLKRKGEQVAMIVPIAPARSTARSHPKGAQAARPYPDLESLRGAAGSLAKPLAWKKMLQIAREDHLQANPTDAR